MGDTTFQIPWNPHNEKIHTAQTLDMSQETDSATMSQETDSATMSQETDSATMSQESDLLGLLLGESSQETDVSEEDNSNGMFIYLFV